MRIFLCFFLFLNFCVEVVFDVGLVETTAINLSFLGEMNCGFQ